VEPGLGVAELSAARAAPLMFKVTHHPGWGASVDDQPAEVLRVVPGFLAVAVPPGRHTVRFLYQPPVWRIPLMLAGWSVLLGFPWLERRLRRKQRRPATIDLGSVDVTPGARG
jgi:uncharacterized membrane protein YfhO